MSKHTPGPWTLGDMGPEPTLEAGAGRVIGVFAEEAPTGSRLPAQCFPPNAEANAALIAAAPEMLEALRQASTVLGAQKHLVALRLEAAIAKAEGRTFTPLAAIAKAEGGEK